jgi:hypothetical protein
LSPIAVVTPHRIIHRGDVSLDNSNKISKSTISD